jgi:cytokinesis protein
MQGARKLSEAGQSLLQAKHFKELLSVRTCRLSHPEQQLIRNYHFQLILLIGNYMNGTGVKGGAFGFRVSSINKVCKHKPSR